MIKSKDIWNLVIFFFTAAPTPVPYSCAEWAAVWNPCHDQEGHTGEAVLQESMAEFSMKLYSFIRESQPSNNLLLSPLSISALLSHLLLGTKLHWMTLASITMRFCNLESSYTSMSGKYEKVLIVWAASKEQKFTVGGHSLVIWVVTLNLWITFFGG